MKKMKSALAAIAAAAMIVSAIGAHNVLANCEDGEHSFDASGSCTNDDCDATSVTPAQTPATSPTQGSESGGGDESESGGGDDTTAAAPAATTAAPAGDDDSGDEDVEFIGNAPAAGGGATPTPSNGSGGSVTKDTPATSAEAAAQVSQSKKAVVVVDASQTGVTEDLVKAFADNKKAKTLTAKVSSSLKIKIDKEDISGEVSDLDFSVSGKDFISAEAIADSAALKDSAKVVQLDFVSDGDFGGVDSVTVKAKVDLKLRGKTAVVYEYANGKLVKVAEGKVTVSGNVEFNADHFGQYVIAVK